MLYASGNALYVLSGQLFMFWELHVKIMLLSGLACCLVHLCINYGKIRNIGTCLKQSDRTVIVSISSMVNKYIYRRLAEDISSSFPGEISIHDYGITGAICHYCLKTWRLRQNGHHFADDIFKWIFFNENIWISIQISMEFVPKGPVNNIPALVQIMAWCQSGIKPLSEPMMVRLPTHLYGMNWVKNGITETFN